jgi:hypothetical protein
MEDVCTFYGHFVGILYGQIVYLPMAIWYILWSFGIFSPFLVCCTEKNLAALLHRFC